MLCSAGSFHSGFVDTEGIVYTCGVGADHRLGHGNKETIWEPKKVEACKNIQVCQIECVDSRTFVITPQGNLIMWGKEPVTGRTHSGPFLYEYLNAYRMYDICGAADFCVAIGIRAKEPIPKPKVDNVSVDAMNPNVQVDNMNRLIGYVIGNYHELGQVQNFNVKEVMGNFIKMGKTMADNSQQPVMYGGKGGQVPAPPSGPPPMNAVYGGPPPQNVAYGGMMGGSQMNMNQGPPPNVAYGGSQMNMGQQGYGGSQMNMQYGGSQMNMQQNMGGSQMNMNQPQPQQGQYGQSQQNSGQQQQYSGSQMNFNNGNGQQQWQ